MPSVKKFKSKGRPIGNFKKSRGGSTRKGLYGGRSGGKRLNNGGFGNSPFSALTNSMTEEKYVNIFGTKNLPKWKRELLEKGELFE